MGLDSVELVMAYEDAFKIEISDADAEKLQTPAAVIALVLQKYGNRPHQDSQRRMCISQVSFYRLRRAFCEELALPRHVLRPDTELAPFLPRNRSRAWKALQFRTGLTHWPQLKSPRWLWLLSSLTGPVLYTTWLLGTGRSVPEAVLGILLSGPLGMLLILFVTRPLQTTLPFRTLGELAKDVGTFQFAAIAGERLPSRDQIAAAVREITLAQLGVSPEEYREDAEFVRDFGID